jgi:excisionase family DNA binding protein
MTDLALLAASLGVSDRTLRRAAERGTIRCLRQGKRRRLPVEEALYVGRRWPLIRSLVRELRTLPNVRMAVLFGSVARGEENDTSDIDLFVCFAEPGLHGRARLLERLEAATERQVQVVSMEDANSLLLAEVLRDGRVLVDRDGDWVSLASRTPQVLADAEKARDELEREVFDGLTELFAEATS